jgi:hypothetical protein
LKQRSRLIRGEPEEAVELEAERAVELAGVGAKWQAGIFDPGMEALKGAAVAGERKAVTSDWLR